MTHTDAAPAPGHPRPQLRREAWTDLSGRWDFCFDDDDRGRDQGWFLGGGPFDSQIVVPYPPESKLSEVHDPGEHAVLWYRRHLPAPARGRGERVVLHFGAVDYHAQVWVNGSLAAEHEGGHTPFSADITSLLSRDGEQVLVVRAEDHMGDVHQPRGKQDWEREPHGIWYHRTSGIWQPVWMEVVPDQHLTTLHWTARPDTATVSLETVLSRRPTEPTWLDVTLRRDERVLAQQSIRCLDQQVEIQLALPEGRHDQALNDLFWTPETPVLVEAELRLRSATGADDEVHSYLGYRSVGVDRGRFLLNGRPYFLRMVLEQGYWPASHLAAPDVSALEEEVRLVKDLGFNGVRLHQKVEDPRFLEICDRMGLLVWEEMPSAYAYSATSVQNTTREWLEILDRDRSHPSVVAWVPLNESWGVRWIASRHDQRSFASALYHLTHAVDPTRPVISNDGWEHTTSDIITIHDYAAAGSKLAQRYHSAEAVTTTLSEWGPGPARILLSADERLDGQAVMVTEFGGIGFLHADVPGEFVYSQATDVDDFLAQLTDRFTALHQSASLAGFCYTQLTDTEQEVNGLLTADRQPKAPMPLIRDIVTGSDTALRPRQHGTQGEPE